MEQSAIDLTLSTFPFFSSPDERMYIFPFFRRIITYLIICNRMLRFSLNTGLHNANGPKTKGWAHTHSRERERKASTKCETFLMDEFQTGFKLKNLPHCIYFCLVIIRIHQHARLSENSPREFNNNNKKKWVTMSYTDIVSVGICWSPHVKGKKKRT